MAPDGGFRQAELAAQATHLVLEQGAQGFHQLQVHALGQAADVVVRFDHRAGTAGKGHGFDNIGIERALGEELGAFDLIGLFLEDIDESGADDLALGFGVGDAGELAEEQIARVAMDQPDIEAVVKQGCHLGGFGLAHQPGVDEDAGQLIADGFLQQHRHNRGIDPAGKAADDPPIADPGARPGDFLLAEGGHGPVARTVRDAAHEALDQGSAMGRMDDLGMELHAVEAALVIGNGGERRAFAVRHRAETGGQGRHPVAVAHPYLLAGA